MKKLAGFILGLVLLLQCGGAFAQTSDYEIIQSYKSRYQSLLNSIKAVQDPVECANLQGEIGRMEDEYTPHQKLLGEGLYPENFGTTIATLRDQLKKSADRIVLVEESRKDKVTIETVSQQVAESAKTIEVISKQNTEYRASIERMTQEVSVLNEKVQELSKSNAGLLQQIKALQLENKNDKESIARLKALTEKLTANIRERDELILKMMDSFVGEYSKPGMTDAQRQNLFFKSQGINYVGKIKETLAENVQYAENTLLTPQDVNLMRSEQKKLASRWTEIRPYVEKLYPDAQIGSYDVAAVESGLAKWKAGIDETIWKNIYLAFSRQNISIGSFNTAAEFQARVLAYVDEQANNPSRETYQTFRSKVWDSPIKDQWLPIIPTEELTVQQRTEIDARIELWGKKVATLLWRWVLIGVFGVAVIAVIAVVIMRKKKPMPPADDEKTGPVNHPTS